MIVVKDTVGLSGRVTLEEHVALVPMERAVREVASCWVLSMSHQWSPPPLAPGGPQPAPGRVAATAAATIEGAIVSRMRESARDMTVAWVSDAFSNLVNGVKRVVSCGETAVSEPAQYFCLGLALASLFWLRYFCALRMSFMAEAQGGSSLCGSSARSAQAVVTGGDHGSPRLGCSDREDWLSQLENRRVPSGPAPLVVIFCFFLSLSRTSLLRRQFLQGLF